MENSQEYVVISIDRYDSLKSQIKTLKDSLCLNQARIIELENFLRVELHKEEEFYYLMTDKNDVRAILHEEEE